MEKKTPSSAVLLCRTMWCEKCYGNKTPQKGNLFLTIGRGRQKYQVGIATENGRFGFTPHIIEKLSVEKNMVTFASTCGMNGCQSLIEENEDKPGYYDIAILDATMHTIPIRDWNALVLYTRDLDYWLG